MENLFRLMVRNALHIEGLRQLLLIRREKGWGGGGKK